MSKTVLISFWEGITVSVEGFLVPNVKVTKFLRVYVDHKLAWDEHVTQLLDKLSINKHLFTVSLNLLDKDSLKLIYYIQM